LIEYGGLASRPPAPTEPVNYNLRLSAENKKIFVAACDRDGTTPSILIRGWIEELAKEGRAIAQAKNNFGSMECVSVESQSENRREEDRRLTAAERTENKARLQALKDMLR